MKWLLKIGIVFVLLCIAVALIVEVDSDSGLDACEGEKCAFYQADDLSWFDSDEYYDEDDIMNALEASAAVGDDALGEDRTENFGHGSSMMRFVWFTRGMATGDVKYGNTYRYRSLKLLENAETFLEDDAE